MNHITKKAFWITSGNVGSRFLNFLATIYLARVLGTSNFGLISIGLSVLGYAVWLSNMGLNTIGTRETAKPAPKREFSPSALFWTRFIAGILVLLMSLLVLFLLPLDATKQQIIALFLMSIIPQALLLDWYFNGLQRYREVAGGTFFKSLVYLVLTYLFISTTADVWWVPLLYLAGNTVAMGYLFTCIDHPVKLLKFKLTRRKAKQVVRKSLTVGLGSSFNEVVQLLPAIVIGAFISTSSAGIYSAAMKVVLIGAMLDRVFVNLFLPMFTRYWSQNQEKARQSINHIFRAMLTIGIMASVFFMVGAEWIVHLLFGNEYGESAHLLKVLCWFLTGTFINSVFAFGLLAINRDQAYLRSMMQGGIVAAILIAGMTAIGEPHWTALAVVISEFSIMAFNYYEFSNHVHIEITKPVISALCTILLSVILFYTLPLSVFGKMPIILIAACLMQYALGGITNKDISWIYQIAKR